MTAKKPPATSGDDAGLSLPKRLTLKELPPDERPRERLLDNGPEALTDAELLAIIIRDGTPQESALDLARRMLKELGSAGGLRELKDRSAKELQRVRGIGPARAAQVKAALALAGRIAEHRLSRGSRLTCSREVYEHYHAKLRDERQEHFYSLLLDTKNRVIRDVQVSKGGLNAAMVNPRDVLRAALAETAAGVIVIHNHPSGDPQPSADDLNLTRRIKDVCEMAGIRFLDHLIVAEEGYVSLADMGRI